MKIVMVSSLYPPMIVGGAERIVQSLAEGLVAGGDEVTVIALTPDLEPTEQRLNGVVIRRRPLANIHWPFGNREGAARKAAWHVRDSYNVAAERDLAAVLAVEKAELVHTHAIVGFSALAWRAAVASPVPLVHTLHDYYLLCPRSTAFREGRNCQRRCTSCAIMTEPRRRQSRSVDAVVGVSRFILDRHLRAGYFGGVPKSRVIHNALTGNEPSATGVPRAPDGHSFTVGYLGRVEAVKGIEVLLNEFVDWSRPNAELRIAGTGQADYVNGLKSRYAQGNIVFEGHVDPAVFLPGLDVLVVPSLWHEPLGMVAFEAFFHGVPVIAARRGGLPEIVNAQCGVLFDPDDRGALQAQLTALMDHPDHRLCLAQGARTEATKYRRERLIADYRGLYQELTDVPSRAFEKARA